MLFLKKQLIVKILGKVQITGVIRNDKSRVYHSTLLMYEPYNMFKI